MNETYASLKKNLISKIIFQMVIMIPTNVLVCCDMSSKNRTHLTTKCLQNCPVWLLISSCSLKCSLSWPNFQFDLFCEYAQALLSEAALKIYFWGLNYKNSIKHFALEKSRKTGYIRQIGHWLQPQCFKCQIISTA